MPSSIGSLVALLSAQGIEGKETSVDVETTEALRSHSVTTERAAAYSKRVERHCASTPCSAPVGPHRRRAAASEARCWPPYR